jgi:hypothetical protein
MHSSTPAYKTGYIDRCTRAYNKRDIDASMPACSTGYIDVSMTAYNSDFWTRPSLSVILPMYNPLSVPIVEATQTHTCNTGHIDSSMPAYNTGYRNHAIPSYNTGCIDFTKNK